jgi:putative intracellular protease/amidase
LEIISLFIKRFEKIFFKRREEMKKIAIFLTVVILVVTGVISLASEVYGQSAKKVLMFLRDGESYDLDLMLKMEVGTMTMLLKKAGFQVDVASSSGQPFAGPHEKIEKVMRLSEIKLDDYMGIIIPCLNIMKGTVTPEAVEVIKKALADGKPVAAAMSAITILAGADLLKGKKYAFIDDPLKRQSPDLRFADAIYSGRAPVQDGKIISSGGCPASERYLGVQNRTLELTQMFIAAIGP